MMRRKVFLIVALCFLALLQAHAQKGLQIDSLFNCSIIDVSDMSRISMSEVSGAELKPYNLKYFRSISFKAEALAIDRVASLVEADSRNALDRKIDYVGGQMYYALLRLRTNGSEENEYVGFQVKGIGREKVTQDSDGKTIVGYELDDKAQGPFEQAYVTVVYLKGKATMNDLKKMFKQR